MIAAATALAMIYQRKHSRIEILRDLAEFAEWVIQIAQQAGLF
jgi:hypothetical protein